MLASDPANALGDWPISDIGIAASHRRVSHWTVAVAIMVMHAQAGHAATRHTGVTFRPRTRSTLVHAAKRPDPERELGNTIVGFALRAQGREIGDGECFSLADQALTYAGARSAAYYSDITPDGDYVWGRPIRLVDARPGDILQFRNYHIQRRVTVTTHGDDGSMSQMQSMENEDRDHHTAIVTANYGTALAIAEQNVEPLGRVVQQNTIDIASGTRQYTNAGTQTTTEVFVDGEISAYRPQRSQAASAAEAASPGI
jgi:hypothetical protein